MNSPCLALQSALVQHLRQDPSITGLVGVPAILDGLGARLPDPYVLVDLPARKNRSGVLAPLTEHNVQITIVAREQAYARVGAIEQAILDRLNAASPVLTGHRLILLDIDATEFRRDAERRLARARLSLRALTEPL
jgi:hypothetical protein